MAKPKNVTPRQRFLNGERRAMLTSPEPLLRPGPGAPLGPRLGSAIATVYRAAAAAEISDDYADRIAKDCLSHGHRLDLLRAALALVFKNASADTVWEAVEYILVPLLIGLCHGQHEPGNTMGTGMAGSDGRDHLRKLAQDEGEPLNRIIAAIARHCPQILYGHPESDND